MGDSWAVLTGGKDRFRREWAGQFGRIATQFARISAHLTPTYTDKVFTIDGTFNSSGDFLLLGHGTSTGANGDQIGGSLDNGLAVLKAGAINISAHTFDGSGYSLVSADSVTLSGGRIYTYPKTWGSLNFPGTNPGKSFMVFKKQAENQNSYTIDKVSDLIDDGIYIETKDMQFTVSGGQLVSGSDIHIHLNGAVGFEQSGGIVSAKSGSIILSAQKDDATNKTSITKQYLLKNGSIATSDLKIIDGARLAVTNTGSNAPIIGTGSAKAGTLTIGGNNFKLNASVSGNHKANGLIMSYLPIDFVGGDFLFEDEAGLPRTSMTGIVSTGAITGEINSLTLTNTRLDAGSIKIKVYEDLKLTGTSHVFGSIFDKKIQIKIK